MALSKSSSLLYIYVALYCPLDDGVLSYFSNVLVLTVSFFSDIVRSIVNGNVKSWWSPYVCVQTWESISWRGMMRSGEEL